MITISKDLDVYAIRRQFPALNRLVKGHPLVYFDNAATSQKPQSVIDALVNYYTNYNANVHRGIHTLAEEATMAFEKTRDAAQQFINAESREQIIFTRGTTKGIIDAAHKAGAVVLIDGAQSTVHLDIDVQEMDCDFFAFSSHKLYGPTGIGVLYGKKELLESMPPFQGGGEMIKEVTFEKTTYNDLPYKYEAGTPNIADAIAFKAALD